MKIFKALWTFTLNKLIELLTAISNPFTWLIMKHDRIERSALILNAQMLKVS